MIRPLKVSLCCVICGLCSLAFAEAPPLEADGLRSVLVRGRVIAPLIPAPPMIDAEIPVATSLPVPPPLEIGGPEPTPAVPKPGMNRPGIQPPVRPGFNGAFRGAMNTSKAAAERAEGEGDRESAGKGRDGDENNRPRFGLFRRRLAR